MADKQIRVSEQVHDQVRQIAKANFRGMGDQVAFWAAKDCPHPITMREDKVANVVGSDETLRFFYCRKCRRHICIDQTNAGVELAHEKKRSAAAEPLAA